jgi:hypothetical protein
MIMKKLIIVISIIIILLLYIYKNIEIVDLLSDDKLLEEMYELCCLDMIKEYINEGNIPSFINNIDFDECKEKISRLQKNKYSIKGLFVEQTYDEIIEYIVPSFVSYVYKSVVELLYFCNGLELYLQHYLLILRSVHDAFEIIYLEGVSSYLNNTQLIAKNIELIGLILVYKVISQLYNLVLLVVKIVYNMVYIMVITTNKMLYLYNGSQMLQVVS